MRKLSSRLKTSSLYMYNKVFQGGPLPSPAYFFTLSVNKFFPDFQSKCALVQLEAIFASPERLTLGGSYQCI